MSSMTATILPISSDCVPSYAICCDAASTAVEIRSMPWIV